VTLDPNGVTFDDPRPGENKRWRALTPVSQTVTLDCTHAEATVNFVNRCLASIRVCAFEDADMSGSQNGAEQALGAWPIRLAGTDCAGNKVGPFDVLTGADGCYTFPDLDPGEYRLSEEGNGIQWEKVQTTCEATPLPPDWRTTWHVAGHASDRWQSTLPRPANTCPADAAAPSQCVTVNCDNVTVRFGNVCLGRMFAFKFHDKNMNGIYDPAGEPFTDANGNGVWDPAEPFTDLPPCDGTQYGDEFYRDLNNNGKWDKAEEWTDLDGDGFYDEPECPIGGWPFRLYGRRADGQQFCLGDSCNIKTGADGVAVFEDVPPPAAGERYTITDEGPHTVHWYAVDLGTRQAWRTTFGPIQPSCPSPGCPIERWEATTPISQNPDYIYCGDSPPALFGNVCLTTVSGTKLVFDDGMPGQVAGKPGTGWEICLAGKDLAGRDVVPFKPAGCKQNDPTQGRPCDGRECDPQYERLSLSTKAPIGLPCASAQPVWYSAYCDANGNFVFADLPPGHYELAEQPDAAYRLLVDKPLLSGFDLECCPETTLLQNVNKGAYWQVFQVYPGTSGGLSQHFLGYLPPFGDTAGAVPGVLDIIPGEKWRNFKQAPNLCREGVVKNVTLVKETPRLIQCASAFPYRKVSQQGTPNIRLHWPLMYEIPGTSWTLTILYGTKTPVQFPGETAPGYVHTDVWKWVLDTDIPHAKLFLDLLHSLPFGQDEVPLISDEVLYADLQDKLTRVQELVDQGRTVDAGLLLGDFEIEVADACITTLPLMPNPTGPSTGIAQTEENPACCKLLLDASYIGDKLKIFVPVKGR